MSGTPQCLPPINECPALAAKNYAKADNEALWPRTVPHNPCPPPPFPPKKKKKKELQNIHDNPVTHFATSQTVSTKLSSVNSLNPLLT